jgi:hypothetical protein
MRADFRKSFGPLEVEAGWFSGEDYALDIAALRWHARDRNLCIVFVQIGKFCASLSWQFGMSRAVMRKFAGEWGMKFEAMAHRETAEKPAAPSAEEIKAARAIVAAHGKIVPSVQEFGRNIGIPNLPCRSGGCIAFSDGGCDCLSTGSRTEAAARAWLEERGIPIEEPEASDAATATTEPKKEAK